jgi:hypothetical protein
MVQITFPLEKDLTHDKTLVQYLRRAKFLVGVRRWLNGKAGWSSKRRRTRETHRNDLEKARIWVRSVHRKTMCPESLSETKTSPERFSILWLQ